MAGESGTCAQCGEPIIGEDPSQRKTCPKCGSTSRNFETSQHVTTSSSITVRAEVDTYPQRLLRVARTFIEQSEFGIAVVVAHMACEIAAERSLSEAFAAKGVQFLQDWVRGLNLGYNLANGRVQRLYTTLTGDEVQKAAFWQKFTESAKRRNTIVHGGANVGKIEAEESHNAVGDLVAHLNK